MRHRLSLAGALIVVAACATGAPAPGGEPTPAAGPPEAPPPTPPGGGAPAAIRLVPAELRYVVHRRLRVEQELAGQPPTVMNYRVFVTAAIRWPADTAGYPVSHVVDSIVPDSGSFVPPTVNFHAARALEYRARITPTGIVRSLGSSDSVAAQTFAQFLGNVRDFYPRLPQAGLTPAAQWTDTVTTAERATAGEVQLLAVHHSMVTGWEPRGGTPCLRIEVRGTFTMQGAGEQAGQPYELTGSGTRSAVEFVSSDGRYLGGERRDSVSLSVSLPAQGLTVPIRQVLQSSVTVLP